MEYKIVDNLDKLYELIKSVRKAQEKFKTYTQEEVDKIFYAASMAANKARIPLADMAVKETKMGVFEDKVIVKYSIDCSVKEKFESAISEAFSSTVICEKCGNIYTKQKLL